MSEWTNPAQRISCVVEMDKPLTVRRERWALVQGDKNANTIAAEVFQTTGKPFDLTGCTVTLTFVRPDNLAVPPITAEVSGNMATATLTDACYRVSGRYNAIMQIQKGGADRTILWLVGDVLENENDGMVDEEGVFPTPEEMLIIFQQVEQAKQAANKAASGANEAAGNANDATRRANEATEEANKWANATAKATAISAESQPTVNVSETGGKKVISFGIPAGKTPNITFNVSTGAPGTQVEIVQSGTPEAPVIDLTIPRGDTGAIDGIDYYDGKPSALGTASPGTANGVARGNHVHPMPSASDVGALPSDGTAANASNFDGKSPEYYLTPVDLLDNSNFTNLVAQAGLNAKHDTETYACDRWVSAAVTVTQNRGYATLTTTSSSARIFQRLPDGFAGKTITAAAKVNGTSTVYVGIYYTVDGVVASISKSVDAPNGVLLATGTIPANATDIVFRIYPAYVDGGGSCKVYWAALYEGSYTIDTLPPYVPKPYTVELAECQRYFLPQPATSSWNVAENTNNGYLVIRIPTPVAMRKTPSLVKNGTGMEIYSSGWKTIDETVFQVQMKTNEVVLSVSPSNLPQGITLTAGSSYLANYLPHLCADIPQP